MPNKTGPEIGRQQNRQNILQIAIQPAKTVVLFCSQSAFSYVLKCTVKLTATKNNPYIDLTNDIVPEYIHRFVLY